MLGNEMQMSTPSIPLCLCIQWCSNNQLLNHDRLAQKRFHNGCVYYRRGSAKLVVSRMVKHGIRFTEKSPS